MKIKPEEIKIGQRWMLKQGGKFIAEVVKIKDGTWVSLKVLQDIGWGAQVGYTYQTEDVSRSDYFLLEGQDRAQE